MSDDYIIDPKESLHNCIVFNARDWSAEATDAWIYGIVVGWDFDDKEICQEFYRDFKWNKEDIKRLKILHENFEKLNYV